MCGARLRGHNQKCIRMQPIVHHGMEKVRLGPSHKHHASSTTKTLDGDGGCGSVHLCVAVRPCVLLLWADESQRARADRYVIRYHFATTYVFFLRCRI